MAPLPRPGRRDPIGSRAARCSDVFEIEHGWCSSIYTTDPNGIMVEFCTSTRVFVSADREEALRLLEATSPTVGPAPPTRLHRAR